MLVRAGWQHGTLKAGDPIVLTMHPLRSGAPYAVTDRPGGSPPIKVFNTMVMQRNRRNARQQCPGDIVVTAERRSVSLQKGARRDHRRQSGDAYRPRHPGSPAGAGADTVGEDRQDRDRYAGVHPRRRPEIRSAEHGGADRRQHEWRRVIREALGGSNIYDVARIEALPDPQGTLYGNSAIAGVINSEFQRPVDEWQEHALLEKGNYDSTHIEATVNARSGTSAAFASRGTTTRRIATFGAAGRGRRSELPGLGKISPSEICRSTRGPCTPNSAVPEEQHAPAQSQPQRNL